jgi:hypothetical protein
MKTSNSQVQSYRALEIIQTDSNNLHFGLIIHHNPVRGFIAILKRQT